ncbi:hypothetical protein Tco_0510844 [Tanacetum coccineum]
MGSITDIKSVLTMKALEIFCKTFHIPNEVHPELPSLNQTIHEMPTSKIGVYTRFFEYANFRLPLSIFLVNVLKHYRIHISQLSVIAAAKVSHFDILCHVHGFEPTVGLFRCFYVDAFACPAFFLWHTAKSVSRDPVPKSSEFNTEHYAILIAYLAPFHKYLEPFLCLIGMSHHYTLDENTYPEFMHENAEGRIGERQCAEDEPKLLDTIVGRVVPLLPIAPARAKSKLEASVDKLFDEGGSGNQVEQGDSASDDGGPSVNIQPVTETTNTVAEIVIPLQPRRPQKRKTITANAGGPLHPPKKLREDPGTPSGASVGGKSRSAVHRLLAEAMQNAEVRGEPIPTLPFVTSSIANVAKAEVDYFARPSVLLMTVATTVTSTVDPTTTVKEKLVESSIFGGGSSSAGGDDHTIGGFSDLTSSDFIVSGICTIISPNTDLQKVAEVRMRAEYNIRERRRLKSVMEERDSLLKARDEEIRNLKAQLLLKEAEAAKAIRLRAEASKFEAVEKSLQNEVKTLKEHNAILEKDKSELDMKVVDLAASVKVREQEVADLDAQVHELETSSAGPQEKVTAYKNCIDQLEKFQDDRMKKVNDKFDKVYTDFVEMSLHLEERFYPHLRTTIAGHRWLLTHDIELVIAKCINSLEFLSALGVAIGKAVEKGMQDGLSAGITPGKEGRVLTDVDAYNPSVEDDCVSALQKLQHVNFSLLTELRSNKDASVEVLMNILRLDDALAENWV